MSHQQQQQQRPQAHFKSTVKYEYESICENLHCVFFFWAMSVHPGSLGLNPDWVSRPARYYAFLDPHKNKQARLFYATLSAVRWWSFFMRYSYLL